MESVKKILIIGGGYGGIEAAKKLEKTLKKEKDVSITLIDRNPFHTLMTELHEVAGYRVEPDSVRVPFSKIFGASRVNVVLDTIESIDFDANKAKSAEHEYSYDYLVIGSGAEPAYFGLPGIKENAFTLWSFDDALRIRHHIESTFEKAKAEQNPEKRKSMLNFVVAGAGFTGIEMAGELLEWRDAMCDKWLIPRDEVRIYVVEAMPTILPILEEPLRDKVAAYLAKKDVVLLTGTPITGAEEGKVMFKDGTVLETDTFIWTCGVQGSSFADSLSLQKEPNGRKGRLLADEQMRSLDHKNVFLVGDNLWFLEENKALPQIVETALQTADTAAHNIAADILGKEKKAFKSNFHGFMVSVGGKYAVSNAGGMKLSGFFAMAMKHVVNLHYLFGIAGVNQCWEYIKHEFLDMDSHRNMVRGFGAYKSRGYWLLPLRLWLGLVWIMEGVNKIGEGWLNWKAGTRTGWMFSKGVVQAGAESGSELAESDAVSAASGDWDASGSEAAGEWESTGADAADPWGESAADATDPWGEATADAADPWGQATADAADPWGQATADAADPWGSAALDTADPWAAADSVSSGAEAWGDAAADGVSAATGELADSAADAVTAATGEWVESAGDAAGAAGDAIQQSFEKVWDLTKPIFDFNGSISTWFRTTFMDNMAAYLPFQFFQLSIVLVEIAIGLALVGGLFTWWAAVASIVLCVVFTLSGMFAWDQLWFIFAAILMMGGAGRAFGLDCWVVPFCKKFWNGTKLARRNHWYLDNPSK